MLTLNLCLCPQLDLILHRRWVRGEQLDADHRELVPSPIAAVLEQSLSKGGVLAILICLVVPTALAKITYILVCVRLPLGFIQTGAGMLLTQPNTPLVLLK